MPPKWDVVKEVDAPKTDPWQVVGEKDTPTYMGEAGAGVVRGMKDMVPSAPTASDLIFGPIIGLVKSGIDTAKGIYQGVKEDEGGWAGKTLRVGENLPLIGPVIKKAEEAGPVANYGEAKMEPQTVGAITEGVTQALIGEGLKAGAGKLSRTGAPRSAAIDASHENFVQGIQQAIPPKMVGGEVSYTPEDAHLAAPHIFDIHSAVPISGASDFPLAVDSAVERVEGHIQDALKDVGPAVINENVLADVQRELAGHPRTGFSSAGLHDLDSLNLDEPITTDRVDAIRRQLNDENKAVLKKNNYDVQTARANDPGFAAREIAARSLREAEYKLLADNGYPDVDQLRREEGALLRIRNASYAEQLTGDKLVPGTESTSLLRKAGRASTGALGGLAGYKTMGLPGATAGTVFGTALGEKLFPAKGLTVDEMIRNSLPDMSVPGAEFPQRQFKPTRRLAAPGVTVTAPEVPTMEGRTGSVSAPDDRGILNRIVLNQREIPSTKLLEAGPIDQETGKPSSPDRGTAGRGILQPYSWIDRSGTPPDVKVPPLAEGIRQTRLARMRHAAGENLLAPPEEIGVATQTVQPRRTGALQRFAPGEAWRMRTDLSPDLPYPEVKGEPPPIIRPKAWVLPQLKRLMTGRGRIDYP